MEHLGSEKEQLEQIKSWLRENGLSIVLGIVLGLGGVYGWRGWQSHKVTVSEGYSARITTIEQQIEAEKYDKAAVEAESLIGDAGSSLYADMSRLLLARAYAGQGELEKAAKPLADLVADQQSVLNTVARLRLARIYLAQSRLDEAGRLIPDKIDGAYAQAFAELKGDLQVARGEYASARSAYQDAVSMAGSDAENQFLRMKLQDLPATE
jgi:predicted negative regulator of RcsB-dependent stress response